MAAESSGILGFPKHANPDPNPDNQPAIFLADRVSARASVGDILAGPPLMVSATHDPNVDIRRTKCGPADVACRWAGVAAAYLGLGSGLCYAVFALFFGGVHDNEHRALEQCGNSAMEAESRRQWHWFISWAPGYLRTAILAAVVCFCFKRVAGIETTGVLQTLLVGDSDGAAGSAGWLAIVGAPDGRPQSTWGEAVTAQALTQRRAVSSAAVKLVCWHLSQPIAYLFLLFSYRCFVAQLGPTQEYLASIVAAR